MMRIRPLVAAPGMQETDMRVFTDTRLMDGQHDTVSIVFSSPPSCCGSSGPYRVGSDGR